MKISWWDRLINVNHPDTTQARRGRLLAILLVATSAATAAGTSVAVVSSLQTGAWEENSGLILSGVALLACVIGLFFLNRLVSPSVAAVVFLSALVAIASFSDQPQQLVGGRTTWLYVLPIIMSSVLLQPATSIFFATLSSAVLFAIASYYDVQPPLSITTVLGFYIIALVGWLAAGSLNRALSQLAERSEELRRINEELDQRVIARTQELAEALAKNQAILTDIADGVVVLDPRGQVTIANPAVGRLLGRPNQQLVGRDVEALMDPITSETERDLLVALFKGGELLRSPSVKIGWGKRTLSVSAAQVRDPAGGMIGTVAVFRDFTREAELDRMKSTLVSVASHELRTPVTAILGYADMLKITSGGLLPPDQVGIIDRIMYNCRRLSTLISNLLDQAQIEAGTLNLTMGFFSPASLIEGLLASISLGAQVKGLELTTHVADDVPGTLYGDSQRVQQILINLVGNAIKFTERGSIDVRVYRPDPSHWAVAVTDTGRGIPEDAQAYIFEPFRQVESSATRRYGGVGLGLSIVKQLANLMGGDITLQSEVGHGSTFTIVLPLTPTTEAISQ